MSTIEKFLENCAAAIVAYEGPKEEEDETNLDPEDLKTKRKEFKKVKNMKFITDLLNMD